MKRFLLALIFAASAAPALGQASDPALEAALSEENGALVYRVLGQELTFPLPRWGQAPVPLADLQRFAAGNAEEALIEVLPQGQRFEAWGQLHWARVAADRRITLEQMRAYTVSGFSEICRPEETKYFIARQDAADTVAPLVFVCGAHARGFGLDGLGEVMIAAYRRSAAGVAVVTTEWRGPAFTIADLATWPISPQGLIARANALDAGTSLTPQE